MGILQTTDLKRRVGKILNAALREPQFVICNGKLFQVSHVSVQALTNPPNGFFADAYPLPAKRRALEAAAGHIPQFLE